MQFGVFDHLDADGQPLQQCYETRLRTIEAYERLGFRGYHMAEHHFTPLGMGAAPSVFLAAVATRTKKLRFGPLIYAVPFSHPIRLAEEIAMLDHLSGGRFEMGFGRGASPIELEYIGHDDASAQEAFSEGVDVILRALTSDRLNYEGKRYRFKDVPMHLRSLQQPHPPMWYGLHSVPSAERVARQGWHVITNEPPVRAKAALDRYREVWAEAQGGKPPLVGLVRHIVVADTDEKALAIARRAFLVWRKSFTWLFDLRGARPSHWEDINSFDQLQERDLKGIAGSPKTVLDWLSAHIETTGANYLLGQHQFGDMTGAETLKSLELYAGEVMPALRKRFG